MGINVKEIEEVIQTNREMNSLSSTLRNLENPQQSYAAVVASLQGLEELANNLQHIPQMKGFAENLENTLDAFKQNTKVTVSPESQGVTPSPQPVGSQTSLDLYDGSGNLATLANFTLSGIYKLSDGTSANAVSDSNLFCFSTQKASSALNSFINSLG